MNLAIYLNSYFIHLKKIKGRKVLRGEKKFAKRSGSTGIILKKEKVKVQTIQGLIAAMADEEVLFDDVYELCEIIGK